MKAFRRGRVPHQRVLGALAVPADLPPESQHQWREVMTNEVALRRYTRSKAHTEHEDHVFSMALSGLHTRLKSGPVEVSVLTYMKRVIKNAAKKNFVEIRIKRQRELPVGEDTYILETEGPVTDKEPTTGVQLMQSLDVVADRLSERQLLVFILAEYEGMTCFEISDAFEGKVSPTAVRQSLLLARQKLADPETRRRLGLEE